jgi:pimeloyl-ACP methyl ester carboxylesterase
MFVDTSVGQIHVATRGPDDGPVVVLLHQTPRSWREYKDVLPLLGARYRAVAVDTPGMGDSSPLPVEASIEGWADVVAEVIAVVGSPVHVIGHHTGGVIAVALAARHPDAVASLVLSSTPYTDEAFRRARAGRPAVDHVERRGDGSHLVALWQGRQGFYPPDRPDLLDAFVRDAVAVPDAAAGHLAVGQFRMEDAIGQVHQPTLVIRAAADPFAAPHAEELAALLPQAQLVEIDGGMVPLPDQLPEQFAAAVLEFLDRQTTAEGQA